MSTTGQPSSSLRERRHLFTAPLHGQHVGISLPRRNAGGSQTSPGRITLDAALALRDAETAIAMLEDWLGQGIVPSPILWQGQAIIDEMRIFRGGAGLQHEASDTRLYLPPAVLLHAEPPPTLEGWRWANVRCRAVLDALPLQVADLENLRTGALVLCPSSFESEWSVRLQPVGWPATPLCAMVRVLSPTEMAFVPLGTPAEVPGASFAQVSLLGRLSIQLPALMGWDGAARSPITVPSSSVVMHGGTPENPLRMAAGRLMAVGRGFGMHLSRVRRQVPMALAA